MREFFDFGYRGFGDRFLYHYTSASGLAGILDSNEFRLSPILNLNDPREYRELLPGFGGAWDGYDVPSHDDQFEVLRALRKVTRLDVRVGCFTDEGTNQADEAYFARGFGRARSWAQYGDAHRGAVIVLDREMFLAPTKDRPGDYRTGPVAYEDRNPFSLPSGEWFTFRHRDVQLATDYLAYATEIRNRHADQFFFKKNTDWSSENEYRVVYWGSGADGAALPVSQALVAIILGELFPLAEANVLGLRLARLGVDRIQIGKMFWGDGVPGCVILSGSLPDLRALPEHMGQDDVYWSAPDVGYRPLQGDAAVWWHPTSPL